jgi:hypothetical protein
MIPDNLQLDCSLGDTGMRNMSAPFEVATLIVPRTTSVPKQIAFLLKNLIYKCPGPGGQGEHMNRFRARPTEAEKNKEMRAAWYIRRTSYQ